MINAMSGTQTTAGIKAGHDPTSQVDFLRLLTIQLQHQDPLNPVDEREFLSQMAQFSTLSELQSIREVLQNPPWQVATLIGQGVTIAGEHGYVSGEVSSVILEGSPRVVVGHEVYPVDWIVEVHKSHG